MSSFAFYSRMIIWNLAGIIGAVIFVAWIGLPSLLAGVLAFFLALGISLLGSQITAWEIQRKNKPDA